MKHRLQTFLKHKLQWLVLLTALFGVSQGVWSRTFNVHHKFGNDWADASMVFSSTNTYRSWIIVDAVENGEFKIKENDNTWWGNNGSFTEGCDNWGFNTSDGNCKFTASAGGEFVFQWHEDTHKLDVWRQLYSLSGDLSGDFGTGKVCTITKSLSASTSYSFKIRAKGTDTYYSCNSCTVTGSISNYNVFTGAGDITMTTAAAGDYVFTFDIVNKRLSITYPGSGSKTYSLGGYINGSDVNNYNPDASYAFVSQGSNVWTLTRSFSAANNYFKVYDNNEVCYGLSSYGVGSPQTLEEGTCTEKAGAVGLFTEVNYTITWNSSTNQISWAVACTAPTITTDVSGDAATYCQGAEATALSVVAGGGSTPYSYQWYKNTSQSTSGASTVGTNASYTPPTNAGGIGTYYYYCVVSSACGQSRQFGYSGAITVDATSVAGDITNYGNKCQGSTVTLGIYGNTGTTYQWQSCNTESGEYDDITVGGDGSEYSAPTSGSVGSTIYYKIKVKNGVCDWATSTTGRPVTILPIPTNLSFTANATVCKETDKTFTLTHDAAPTGSTYSYAWTYPTTSNWSKKSGGTSSDASAVITVGTANGTVKVKPTLTTSGVGCLGTEKSSVITVQGPTNYSINATPASGYTPWKPVTLSTSTSASAAWSITSPSPVGTAYLSTESGSSTKLKAPDNNGGSGTSYTVSATVTDNNNCSLTRTKTITVTAPDCD